MPRQWVCSVAGDMFYELTFNLKILMHLVYKQLKLSGVTCFIPDLKCFKLIGCNQILEVQQYYGDDPLIILVSQQNGDVLIEADSSILIENVQRELKIAGIAFEEAKEDQTEFDV